MDDDAELLAALRDDQARHIRFLRAHGCDPWDDPLTREREVWIERLERNSAGASQARSASSDARATAPTPSQTERTHP